MGATNGNVVLGPTVRRALSASGHAAQSREITAAGGARSAEVLLFNSPEAEKEDSDDGDRKSGFEVVAAAIVVVVVVVVSTGTCVVVAVPFARLFVLSGPL